MTIKTLILSVALSGAMFASAQTPCDSVTSYFEYVVAGFTVEFTGLSETPDALNTTYFWDFGNGNTSNAKSPVHVFQPGTWWVCTTVFWQGCTSTFCDSVTVGNGNPCSDLSTVWTWGNGQQPQTIEFASTTTYGQLIPFYLEWDFDDGAYSNLANAQHTYTSGGVYEVCLTVWGYDQLSQDTCMITECQQVFVLQSTLCDSLDAGFSPFAGGLAVNIANHTIDLDWNYYWQFGDGTTGSGPNPYHQYALSGQYEICLLVWVWDPFLQDTCYADHCETVIVSDGQDCVSLMNAGVQSNGVPGNGVQFNAVASLPPGGAYFEYSWSFGDGAVGGNAPSPLHFYPQPGSYVACMFIEAYDQFQQFLCSDSVCVTVVAQPGGFNVCDSIPLEADFDAAVNGNDVQFQDLSFTSGFAATYIWDLGDGASSTLSNPAHSYFQPGVYTVCLEIAIGPNGGNDSCFAFYCDTIVIGGANPCDDLNADFIASAAGLSVNFNNAAFDPQWTYIWQFGDGTTGSGVNPLHEYTNPGPYYVCLVVWAYDPLTQDTCYADQCEWVVVTGNGNGDCDSTFAITTSFLDLGNGLLTFTAATSLPADGIIWTFGDGSLDQGAGVDHQYAQTGQYFVCANAWYYNTLAQDTCWTTSCQWIGVTVNDPCDGVEACFVPSLAGPNAFFFNNCSATPDQTATYFWAFGDGAQSSLPFVTHTFPGPGTYETCLIVEWNGCLDSICHPITIPPIAGCDSTFMADFTTVDQGSNILVLFGTANMPAFYVWDMGDGQQEYGMNTQHFYADPGTYYVCLNAWYWNSMTQDTCWTTTCMWVNVGGGGSVCDSIPLGADYSFTSNNNVLLFSDQSTTSGYAATYIWDFGDGGSSTDQNPVHTYLNSGVYEVCLYIAIGPNGGADSCFAFTCSLVTVDPCDGVEACFVPSPSGTNMVFFNNCSATPDPSATYLWTFGDGTQGTSPFEMHTYPGPGTYEACLYVEWNGCLDSICHPITIPPIAGCDSTFMADFTSVDQGSNILVLFGTANMPAFYVWDMGDGQQEYGMNTQHFYADPGTYYVCLNAWYWNSMTQDTCWTTTCMWVNVGGGGSVCDSIPLGADYSFTSNNNVLLFSDQSTTSGYAATYIWDFGDGGSSTDQNPVHTYLNSGVYEVCLYIAIGPNGGADSCFAFTCSLVTVGFSDPCDSLLIASFIPDLDQGSTWTFINQTISPDIQNTQFLWDFGDGNGSTIQMPDHTYANPGNYSVCLTAWWGNCSSTVCAQVIVSGGGTSACDSLLIPSFTWLDQGGAVVFTNTSQTNGLNAQATWDLGNGTMAQGDVVTAQYTTSGIIPVCLTLWAWNPFTQDSCVVTYCESIFVGPTAISESEAGPDLQVYPNPFSGTITLSGEVVQGWVEVRLLDMTGRMVMAQQHTAHGSLQLEFSGLPQGAYLLEVNGERGRAILRVVGGTP